MDYVVGEEEAVWLVKLILPCVNEFLLKIKALFSGDPATTMKVKLMGLGDKKTPPAHMISPFFFS